MIGNFLKIALRNLMKQRLFAFFNILSVAVGIACCTVVYLFIQHQYSQDAFHANAATIFMVNHVRTTNGEPELWASSPDAIGPALKAALPEVKHIVRLQSVPVTVQSGDHVFNETLRLADPDFFRMFSFPMQAGNANPLDDPSGLVLSDAMARKYFGEKQAIGQSLTVIFDGQKAQNFIVRAVVAPFPNTASFSFGLLAGYGVGRQLGWRESDWTRAVQATFIQLDKPASAGKVAAILPRLTTLHNQINSQAPVTSFYLDKLTQVSLNAHKTRHALSEGTSPTALIVLGVLACLVLCMACFNFMNYTIATSTTRFKEIGVRKVLGSSRRQLIRQFMAENVLVGGFALALGLLLTSTLFLPAFSQLIDYNQLRFNLVDNWQLITFLLLLIIGISLLSGAYPSVYISGFNPISVLKGRQRIASTSGFVRTLLVAQFGLSLFTVASALLTSQNAQFLRHMDVGYEQSQLVVLRADSEPGFNQLRDAAIRLPGVTGTAGSQDQIGRTGDNVTTIEDGPAKTPAEVMHVTPDYVRTLNLRLRQGRNFLPGSTADADQAIIVNQALVKAMGWTSAVGKRVRLKDTICEIVGVVDDFNYRFFFLKIAPCVLAMNLPASNRVLTLKVNGDNIDQLTNSLKTVWQKAMPNVPFELSWQTDVYSASYDESRRVRDVFTYVAVLTLLISGMALFALVSLNIARKTKEIGIRKVLGASAFSIANLVNREFLFLITIAGCIFLPLAFFALGGLLGSVYAYHIPVTATPFISALGIMLILSLLTIGSQVYRIATANPVKALQTE